MKTVAEAVAIRDIPGFPGYRVTPDGVVYSSRSGRWRTIKPYFYNGGLGVKIALRLGGETFRPMLARVVLQTFEGPAPLGMVCIHKNGDPADCRLENLRWGRRREVGRRVRRGESHPRAKFDSATVAAIREAHRGGARCSTLARKYGVSRMAVAYAVSRATWKHVPDAAALDALESQP